MNSTKNETVNSKTCNKKSTVQQQWSNDKNFDGPKLLYSQVYT